MELIRQRFLYAPLLSAGAALRAEARLRGPTRPMRVWLCAQGHERAGATGRAHASLRWAADYLMACHTAPGEFVGQARALRLRAAAACRRARAGRAEDTASARMRQGRFAACVGQPRAAGLTSARVSVKPTLP